MENEYRLVGADGREYGPVTATQVREWIQQHRADASTRARVSGGEWKPLAAFPEFAEALAIGTAAGTASIPIQSLRLEERIEADIRTRGFTVEIGAWLGQSWDLFCRYPLMLVGATAILLVIKVLLHLIPPGFVAGLVLFGPLIGGFELLLLRLARGERPGVEAMFSGFQVAFVQLLVLGLVGILLVSLGLVALIIPGLYLLVVWSVFPFLLVADRGLDFWPALVLSLKVSNQHLVMMFLFVVVVSIVAALGVLACCVGLLVTLPWAIGAMVYAYEDVFSRTRGLCS